MPYGLYISSQGAEAQSRRLEILSNNLANVDTPGFKRELAVLQARHSEAIEQGQDYAGSRTINNVGGGVEVESTVTEFAQGALQNTGIPSDLAILGDGFFEVDHDGHRMLTRAGNFLLNGQGRLITADGDSVLGDDGRPVTLDPTLPWAVSSQGVVKQEATGANIPLSLVKPLSLGDLVKVGQNLFSPLARTVPVSPESRNVRSGFIERSNVRPAQEMMQLIETSRAYEANVKLIQNQDHMIGQLVTRVLRG